jgi:hypothetical protein
VLYVRRRIDFSPRVDGSGGADGLRTVAVVVVTLVHVGGGRGGVAMSKGSVLGTEEIKCYIKRNIRKYLYIKTQFSVYNVRSLVRVHVSRCCNWRHWRFFNDYFATCRISVDPKERCAYIRIRINNMLSVLIRKTCSYYYVFGAQ